MSYDCFKTRGAVFFSDLDVGPCNLYVPIETFNIKLQYGTIITCTEEKGGGGGGLAGWLIQSPIVPPPPLNYMFLDTLLEGEGGQCWISIVPYKYRERKRTLVSPWQS